MVGGTTQEVFVETEPAGRGLQVDRQGATIGLRQAGTRPGQRSCALQGKRHPELQPRRLRTVERGAGLELHGRHGAATSLLGGVVGIAVDAASGANNKYPDRVMVVA